MISVPEDPSADNHQPNEENQPNSGNRWQIPARSVCLSRKKVRRAFKVQHGHSFAEQCLYAVMWDAGAKEGRESRLITIGFDRLSHLASLDKKHVRIDCGRLIDKLALDLVERENSRSRTGRTYRVWSWSRVIDRRINAGMEWYIKTRGVEFVRPPDEFPEAQARWDAHLARKASICEKHTDKSQTICEKHTDTVSDRHTDTVCSSPPPLNQCKSIGKYTSSTSYPRLVEVLRTVAGHADDDAARRILEGCLAQVPDATEEEIAHFISIQAARVAKNPRIENLVGFLIHQVPKCFEGESFHQYRESEKQRLETVARVEAERQQAYLEMLVEQRAILSDPHAREDDKQFARQMLDLT